MVVVRVACFVFGAALVAGTMLSALITFVVPRALPVRLTRVVFLAIRGALLTLSRTRSYERRDEFLAMFAPLALVTLPMVWLLVVLGGFTLMFWGLGGESWREAFVLSGSSLLTLGFAVPRDLPESVMTFLAAGIGLGLLALLISYLPTIYSAFSRRETVVAMLEVRAGTPPSAVTMIDRYYAIRGLEQMNELWPVWETWFADLEESHTSLGSLPFFRSPQPERSWVTAAGAVLDAASLVASTLDMPRSPEAELSVRSGYVALRRICDFFALPYDPDPKRGDPISIERREYDEACDRLAAAGVPIREDRDEAWLDFAGWRVNYDEPLRQLAGLVAAPYAPWSSDRAAPYRRPPLTRRHRQLPTGPGSRSASRGTA
jgi:hypothetical protein